jgi:hypothetical protein
MISVEDSLRFDVSPELAVKLDNCVGLRIREPCLLAVTFGLASDLKTPQKGDGPNALISV